jgi:hypothetical protein
MIDRWNRRPLKSLVGLAAVMTFAGLLIAGSVASAAVQNPQSGSTGLQGKISAPPPSTGATISLPRDGQVFTTLPINVTGICPKGLLVKLFKNNVFAGSTQCDNGSFSLTIDLFSGQNEIIARVYDTLDQAGPDSNKVTVNFNDNHAAAGNRVSLSSNFAKRGANPKDTLTWPIIMSGGVGPYAISVDWGDGKPPDLQSQAFPGNFDIKHVYDSAGVYNIIVKASDKNGDVAYLQLVGIANGPLSQTTGNAGNQSGNNNAATKTPSARIVWQPAALLIPFIMSTFWLGKKYEIRTLRKKIERGDRPF